MRRRPQYLILISVIALVACGSSSTVATTHPATVTVAPSPSVTGVVVSNATELTTALAIKVAQEIVLLPGSYDSAAPFVNDSGHRLKGAEQGRAVLTAGLVFGGSPSASGGSVEGLAFDVRESTKTLQGAAIHVWGGATGVRIRDVTINGGGVLGSAITARQPDGLVIQRLKARGFADYGVVVDANDQLRNLRTPALIEDVEISNVSRARPRSSGGTAEACLWAGNTAVIRRAILRSCAWTGLWTGTATRGSIFEDLMIDESPVAVYVEHFTTASVFQRLRLGPNVNTGLICEWADPNWGGRPACVDNVIRNSTIATCAVGVNMGSGTTRTTVRDTIFVGQSLAAAIDAAGIDNVFENNDYGALGVGAIPVAVGAAATALSAAVSGGCPGR